MEFGIFWQNCLKNQISLKGLQYEKKSDKSEDK
jgi:hypothetical protein